MSSQSSGTKDAPDNEELLRFREQWRQEVRRRKQAVAADAEGDSTTRSPTSTDGPDLRDVTAPSLGGFTPLGYAPPRPDKLAWTQSVSTVAHGEKTVFTEKQIEAIDVYGRAIESEAEGDLDGALRLYRQAFRIYDHIDKLWHKAEIQARQLQKHAVVAPVPDKPGQSSQSKPLDSALDMGRLVQAIEEVKIHGIGSQINTITHNELVSRAAHTRSTTGELEKLINSFPAPLSFEPEDDRYPVLLNRLPEEILVYVLTWLNDPAAVERFALVCRKARIVTLGSTLWRYFVTAVYQPSQLPHLTTLDGLLESYKYDYRQLWVDQPRLRVDGVYIAVCHYVRAGLSENPWINMSHLITYHRYLRFFSNGEVLSLLANESDEPQEVIANLKPDAHLKGLFLGRWSLHIDNHGTSHVHIDELEEVTRTSSYSTRYIFQMVLTLRSRPRGRWNTLKLETYESIQRDTGDINAFTLKHERPFWFSKVRSYSIM